MFQNLASSGSSVVTSCYTDGFNSAPFSGWSDFGTPPGALTTTHKSEGVGAVLIGNGSMLVKGVNVSACAELKVKVKVITASPTGVCYLASNASFTNLLSIPATATNATFQEQTLSLSGSRDSLVLACQDAEAVFDDLRAEGAAGLSHCFVEGFNTFPFAAWTETVGTAEMVATPVTEGTGALKLTNGEILRIGVSIASCTTMRVKIKLTAPTSSNAHCVMYQSSPYWGPQTRSTPDADYVEYTYSSFDGSHYVNIWAKDATCFIDDIVFD